MDKPNTRLKSTLKKIGALKDLAPTLGVSVQTLSRYCTGDREPSSEFLQILHEDFDVNINWLFTGKGKERGASNIEDLKSLYPKLQDIEEWSRLLKIMEEQPQQARLRLLEMYKYEVVEASMFKSKGFSTLQNSQLVNNAHEAQQRMKEQTVIKKDKDTKTS